MADRKIIKQFVNDLIAELDRCDDADFVDEYISRVSYNEPFDDIGEQSDDE